MWGLIWLSFQDVQSLSSYKYATSCIKTCTYRSIHSNYVYSNFHFTHIQCLPDLILGNYSFCQKRNGDWKLYKELSIFKKKCQDIFCLIIFRSLEHILAIQCSEYRSLQCDDANVKFAPSVIFSHLISIGKSEKVKSWALCYSSWHDCNIATFGKPVLTNLVELGGQRHMENGFLRSSRLRKILLILSGRLFGLLR